MYYNSYPYFLYAYQYPAYQLAINPFPPVDTHKFKNSATQIKAIMQQAQLLTDKINSSQQFAHDLMNAAQLSNKAKVEQLITSTGITMKFETNYTPDSFQIRLINSGCCGITLNMNW
ncbi:hypothetical protein MHB42_18885 [Lysinibacillus sp. FSL K6-0232]|uniref:hypothetical protein n=1 Tax=unclassified Lysinibacillus TaxID=2636778 RepID=UPI0030FC76C8